jgi:hypothetical protein
MNKRHDKKERIERTKIDPVPEKMIFFSWRFVNKLKDKV